MKVFHIGTHQEHSTIVRPNVSASRLDCSLMIAGSFLFVDTFRIAEFSQDLLVLLYFSTRFACFVAYQLNYELWKNQDV